MICLYRFRGVVLGIFALVLFLFPPHSGKIPLSAVGLAAAGVLLRIEARRVMGEHSRGNRVEAPALVTWGIYSRLRHPLYVSNLCVCYAFILFHLGWQWNAFAFAGVVTLFVVFLALRENAFLEKRFGESYRRWANRTAMFFPCRNKNVELDGVLNASKKSVKSAFIADKWTWIWLVFYTLLLMMRKYVMDIFPF